MGNILNKKLAKGGHRPARDTLPRYSFLFRPWMILIHSPPCPFDATFPNGGVSILPLLVVCSNETSCDVTLSNQAMKHTYLKHHSLIAGQSTGKSLFKSGHQKIYLTKMIHKRVFEHQS